MHNEILSIGPVTIYGYGLMLAIGIVSAYLLAEYRARRIDGLDDEQVFGLTAWAVVGGLIGGKILYYLTVFGDIVKNPSLLFSDLAEGFVIYGSLIGGILGVVLYCRWRKLNCLSYFDLAVPSVALAQGFGRIGCLLAGCCYGRETSGPLAIVFHTSDYAPNGVALIPTQIISSILNFIHFAILIVFAKKYKKGEGQVAGLYFILYSAGRFVLEFFRGDMERGSVGILSTSQFISLFMFVFGIALFFAFGKLDSKVAGSVSIIGGADGPTSIFLAGKTTDGGKNLKQYQKKLDKLARTLDPQPHTLEEVEAYLVEKYQAELLPADSEECRREERLTRGNLLFKEKPELLQTPFPELPEDRSEEDMKRYMEQVQKRMEEAERISEKEFPTDFCRYRILLGREQENPGGNAEVAVNIEKNYQILQVSYSWCKRGYKERSREMMKDIYRYYGVSREDIENRTERFLMLAQILITL